MEITLRMLPRRVLSTLTSNVTAMPICRKYIKIDTGSISYLQLNYSRVIRIINAREIIFRYELVHIPSSRLKDDGSMGRATFKYRLKKKITSPTTRAYAYA